MPQSVQEMAALLRRPKRYEGLKGFLQVRACNVYAHLTGLAFKDHTLSEYGETLLDVALALSHCPYTRAALCRVRTLMDGIPKGGAKALREGR